MRGESIDEEICIEIGHKCTIDSVSVRYYVGPRYFCVAKSVTSIQRTTMAAEETRLEADRRKALGLAISQIEKQLGKGSIMRMGSESARAKVAAIPTGAINLDAATGVGGIPRGRITEIYGPESSGKTTLTLHLVANVQKAGGVAAYVDAEHALDVEYAKKLGVNIEELLVSQPDTGEQALEIVDI